MGRDRTAKFHNRFKRPLVRRWCWGDGATRASRPMQAHGWGELRVGKWRCVSTGTEPEPHWIGGRGIFS
jgi:hypothetical protein